MRSLSVAVVGCGTAGAAAALFLSRAGHDVTVFERVPVPGPVGAGIMMQPSGLVVLEALGCAAPILASGAKVDKLVARNHHGADVLSLSYGSLHPGLFGVGLHRGVLFETLFSAVGDAPLRLRCGVSVARAPLEPSGKRALYTDGGEPLGRFDLVVVADGARSALRDAMHDVPKHVAQYPWGALWFIGDDPDDRYRGVLLQRVRGTRDMVGMLPTGKGPGGGTTPHTSLFFSVPMTEVDAWRARGVARFREHVMSFAPEAEALLEQIDDMAQLTFAAYADVTMPRWHAPGAVFLGDSAHATSPQLGQGCNLALTDAMTLDACIREERSLDAALDRYSARRRDHLRFYQLATRWLTPFFQSDMTPLGVVRDLLMARSRAIGFFEREMVRSMCGTKTGFVTGSMETRMPR